MQDDAKINKPCAQLPLFAFGLHGPGDVIGEMRGRGGDASLFRCDCVRVHFPVKHSVGQKMPALGPDRYWARAQREPELKRQRVPCDV